MVIGFKGDLIDLVIREGASFRADGVVANADGAPFNIATCSIVAVLKKRFDSPDVVVFDVEKTNAVLGKYAISLSPEVTNALEAGATEQDPKSRYVWSLDLVEVNGRVSPLAHGDVYVFRKLKTA